MSANLQCSCVYIVTQAQKLLHNVNNTGLNLLCTQNAVIVTTGKMVNKEQRKNKKVNKTKSQLKNNLKQINEYHYTWMAHSAES